MKNIYLLIALSVSGIISASEKAATGIIEYILGATDLAVDENDKKVAHRQLENAYFALDLADQAKFLEGVKAELGREPKHLQLAWVLLIGARLRII